MIVLTSRSRSASCFHRVLRITKFQSCGRVGATTSMQFHLCSVDVTLLSYAPTALCTYSASTEMSTPKAGNCGPSCPVNYADPVHIHGENPSYILFCAAPPSHTPHFPPILSQALCAPPHRCGAGQETALPGEARPHTVTGQFRAAPRRARSEDLEWRRTGCSGRMGVLQGGARRDGRAGQSRPRPRPTACPCS
jgi:hypothetical protein